ncbi:MAG: hypothetical protein AMS20_09860 [Gemmatimonas sp. SG8_28]|nr:MAG: hypothetical protein AMS20_09860 [Gemmatimonas sp. SG8_28]
MERACAVDGRGWPEEAPACRAGVRGGRPVRSRLRCCDWSITRRLSCPEQFDDLSPRLPRSVGCHACDHREPSERPRRPGASG